jgi:DNA polymerase (family X)
MSINPNAHSIAELDLLRWGIAMAKGGVPKEWVLNCLGLRAFTKHVADRRPMRRAAVRRSDPASSRRGPPVHQSSSC